MWLSSLPEKMEALSCNGLRRSGSVDKNSPGPCVTPAPPKKPFGWGRVGLWTEQMSLFEWACCWGNSKMQLEIPERLALSENAYSSIEYYFSLKWKKNSSLVMRAVCLPFFSLVPECSRGS